jgi:asparagine synthase (glutamine-hydrolysing)
MVNDLLSHGELVGAGFVRPAALQQLVRADRTGRADRAKEIWHLLTLEQWMRQVAQPQPTGAR